MAEKSFPTITLDGPAGAGKSTMARYLADALDGFAYLDTGALYRTIALALAQSGFTINDINTCRAAVIDTACNARMRAKFVKQPGGGFTQNMYLGGAAVEDAGLRTPEISQMASACSVDPVIRNLVTCACRLANESQALVVDGRDAGTAIFPEAVLKFYLYAPVHDRTMRRMFQDAGRGLKRSYDETLNEITTRDQRDSTREHDPLRFPPDAIWIDTGMFLPETERRFLLDMALARLNPETARII